MVFAAPVDYQPPAEAICATSQQRRRRAARGSAFIWCTLAALGGTPIGDAATRAVLGCEMFVKPVSTLSDGVLSSDSAVEFNFGVERARSVLQRPLLDSDQSPPAWSALAQLTRHDSAIVAALGAAVAGGDRLLEGWAERVSPLVIGDVPAHLIANLPDFEDSRLDAVSLTPQAHPLSTKWLPLPPSQEPAGPEAPSCPRRALELLTPEGRARLIDWLDQMRLDLLGLRDQLREGTNPADVRRRRPAPIAVGQSEFEPWATFESLVWSIGGVLIKSPTTAQFRSMRSGIDGARLAPPRSKPDQWGEIHCPFAMVLTYDESDPINAAAALRDVEIRQAVPENRRATTPLFADGNGTPYSHHFLHSMLKAAVSFCYGEAVAALYTWHSYRSGLATALHAAKVEDGMIQLICIY